MIFSAVGLGELWLLLVAELHPADLSHSCLVTLAAGYIVFFLLGLRLYCRALLSVGFAIIAVTSAASIVWFALHYSTWLQYGFHDPWRFRRQLSLYSWTPLIGTPDALIITLLPFGVLFARKESRRFLAAFLVYFTLGCALLLCLLSLSRTTYLALLLEIVCFLLLARRGGLAVDRSVRTALAVTGVAAIIAVAFIGYLPSVISVLGLFVHHEQVLSAAGHWSRIVDSLAIIKQHPVLGVGLGGYARALFEASHGRILANQALNSYIELSCEAGIIYVMMQGIAVAAVGYAAFREWRSKGCSRDPAMDRYRAACVSSLIGTATLNCAWSATLHSPLDYIACAAILGQLNASSNTTEQLHTSSGRSLNRCWVSFATAFAIVLALSGWAPDSFATSIGVLFARNHAPAVPSVVRSAIDPSGKDGVTSDDTLATSLNQRQTLPEYFSRRIQSYPKDDAADFLDAEYKRTSGDLRGSLFFYDRAIELAPQDWLYRLRYAAALATLQETGAATQQLASAFYLKPVLVRLFHVDGSWLTSIEGRKSLSLALQIAKSQQSLDAPGRIASLLYWSGNYSLAQPYIGECLRRLPSASVCWYLKSESAARVGQYDESSKDLKKSLYLQPPSNSFLYVGSMNATSLRNGKTSGTCSIPDPWWQREQFFSGREASRMDTPSFACATNSVESTIRELSSASPM